MDWVHSKSPAPSVHRAITHKFPTKLIAAHAQFARPIGPLTAGADRDHPSSAVHDGQRVMPIRKHSIMKNTRTVSVIFKSRCIEVLRTACNTCSNRLSFRVSPFSYIYLVSRKQARKFTCICFLFTLVLDFYEVKE